VATHQQMVDSTLSQPKIPDILDSGASSEENESSAKTRMQNCSTVNGSYSRSMGSEQQELTISEDTGVFARIFSVKDKSTVLKLKKLENHLNASSKNKSEKQHTVLDTAKTCLDPAMSIHTSETHSYLRAIPEFNFDDSSDNCSDTASIGSAFDNYSIQFDGSVLSSDIDDWYNLQESTAGGPSGYEPDTQSLETVVSAKYHYPDPVLDEPRKITQIGGRTAMERIEDTLHMVDTPCGRLSCIKSDTQCSWIWSIFGFGTSESP